MKSKFIATLFALLPGIILCSVAHAALTTNSWSGSTGKWELGANWSAGTPSTANALNAITITFPVGSRFVTVDTATIASNLLNNCLTISNLTISGTSLSPNTLILNSGNASANAGLTMRNSLFLSAHGILSITNSYMYVNGAGIYNNGDIVLNNGTLITANTIETPTSIGYTSTGQMSMQGGYFQSDWIIVGGDIYGDPGQGTLTISGGVVNTGGNGMTVGLGGSGTVWLTGGQLIQSNTGTGIQTGQMTISNGLWQAPGISVAFGQGTLTIAGGSITLTGGLGAGGGFSSSPTVSTIWMTGGTLLAPGQSVIGTDGPANMTVSNGTWQQGFLIVGDNESSESFPGTGTVSVAGGNVLVSSLHLGVVTNCLGSIWQTGGFLTVTGNTYVGEIADGQVTVSNGTFLADEIDVGGSVEAFGTLTSVGGHLVVTNGAGRIAIGVAASDIYPVSGSGQGRMTVGSSGSVVTRFLDVGADQSPQGELTIGSSGTLTVLSRMTVGDCTSNGFGMVVMTGGRLYVTNATHDATLEVRNGFFLLDGGTVVADRLVVTNTCYGIINHNGGTLTASTVVLDPNGDADGDGLPNAWEQQYGLDPLSTLGDNGADGDPDGDGYSNLQEYLAGTNPRDPSSTPGQAPPYFQIILIQASGNNVLLNWTAHSGTTNQVQVTSGGTGGAYSTNGFTNVGGQLLVGGSGIVTNTFTDFGGATNKPARYYRVRLVP